MLVLVLVLTVLLLLLLVLSLVLTAAVLSTPVLSLADTSGVRGSWGGSHCGASSGVVIVATVVTASTITSTSTTRSHRVSTGSSTGSHGAVTTEYHGRREHGSGLAHETGLEDGVDGGGVLLGFAGAGLAVSFDGDGQRGHVDHALVLNLVDGLEGGDRVGRVGGRLGVDLLDGEAAAKGTGDGVVAAPDGADVAC